MIRRRRASTAWNPLTPERPARPAPIYADGSYVVSSCGEAATWAVFHQGRWGLVYELNGVQVLSAWVHERDVPIHVLVEALQVNAG